MNVLNDFEASIKLKTAHPEIIKAVQEQLVKIQLLRSPVDGVAGPKTMAAFAKFKQLEYLEHPEILGKSTATALLEATESRSAPADNSTPDIGDRLIRIPEAGQIYSSQPIYPGSHFSWGELTKGLDRIPESAQITRNLIKLAKHLDAVRELLGGRAITITSGYRPRAVNRAVGGASNSRHLFGDAADIVVAGLSPHGVYQRLNAWHDDRGGLGDSRSFTHIDVRGYRARWAYGNA